jgi:hypothetical protein
MWCYVTAGVMTCCPPWHTAALIAAGFARLFGGVPFIVSVRVDGQPCLQHYSRSSTLRVVGFVPRVCWPLLSCQQLLFVPRLLDSGCPAVFHSGSACAFINLFARVCLVAAACGQTSGSSLVFLCASLGWSP